MTKISNQYSLTNVLFADAVNGRVGIGTETPTEKLTVIGNIKIDNGAADGGQLTLASSGYSNWNIDNYSGSLRAYYNATEFLRITSSGYFSINSAVTSNGLVNIKQIGSARYGGINIYDDAGNTFLGLGNTGSLCVVEANYNTGSYTPLAFYTGGSERMRITSAGNVGIGTSSPTATLHVIKDGSGNSNSSITGSQLILSRTSAAGENLAFRNTGTSNGINGTNYTAQILSDGNNVLEMYTTGALPLVFGTNATERMRITSGGFIKISNTGTYANATSNYHEIVTSLGDQNPVWIQNRSTSTPYGPYISFPLLAPNNLTQYFLACGDSATSLRFVMYSNGSLYNSTGVYAQLSDIKLKENIVDATPKLDDLLKVKIRNYNLIGDELKQIGVIAQELEEIFPNMIDNTVDKDTGETTKGVKYSIFIPMLIKGLQEQQTQINELKALLNA